MFSTNATFGRKASSADSPICVDDGRFFDFEGEVLEEILIGDAVDFLELLLERLVGFSTFFVDNLHRQRGILARYCQSTCLEAFYTEIED